MVARRGSVLSALPFLLHSIRYSATLKHENGAGSIHGRVDSDWWQNGLNARHPVPGRREGNKIGLFVCSKQKPIGLAPKSTVCIRMALVRESLIILLLKACAATGFGNQIDRMILDESLDFIMDSSWTKKGSEEKWKDKDLKIWIPPRQPYNCR